VSNITVELLSCPVDEERELILASILRIQAIVYPPTWLYEDSESYFRSMLASDAAIHVVVRDSGKIVGYLLAVPLSTAMDDLVSHDPCVSFADPNGYYIDTFEALPRNGFGSTRRVIRTLEAELRSRGIDSLMFHARVSTGLSKVLKHYFGIRVQRVRRIERWEWYGGLEPTEFMEIEVFAKGVR
jgi:hypothetical protein